MIGALLYLEVRSRANALRARLRRLREPRYAIGALFGLVYLWFIFGRHLFAAPGTRGNPFDHAVFGGFATLWDANVGAAAVAAYLFAGWFFGGGQAKLPFTEAEVAWLFPAPLARRTLVQFKLLQAQFAVLLTSLVLAALASAGSGAAFGPRLLAWWVVFSLLNLHGTAASFTRERLANRGFGPPRRRLVLGGLALALLGATAWSMHARVAVGALPAWSIGNAFELLHAALATPPLVWVLAPFRWIVAPFHAATPGAVATALVPAVALLALHYVWALRTIVGFEEASAVAAEKRASLLRAARRGKSVGLAGTPKARPEPYRLAPRGRPELAGLWSRLVAFGPWFHPRRFLLLAAMPIGAVAALRQLPEARPTLTATGAIAVGIAAYLLILAPAFVRRTWVLLFENLDLLKSYPLRGRQVVLGELLGPIALLAAIELTLLGVAAVALPGSAGRFPITGTLTGAAWLAAAAMLPPLAGLLFGAQLALILVLPGWFRPGAATVGGFEVIGQRLIFALGFLLVFVVALLPAAAAAAVPLFLVKALGGPLPLGVLAGGGTAALALLAEFAGLLWWIGRRFEHLDLSQDLAR